MLPVRKLAVYGVQHVLAFYAGAVLVPILLALGCAGREDLVLRWYDALPDTQLAVLLGGVGNGTPARPARRVADVPDAVRAALET